MGQVDVPYLKLLNEASVPSAYSYVEESETARKLQLYATSIIQVHSFDCQLDLQLGFELPSGN